MKKAVIIIALLLLAAFIMPINIASAVTSGVYINSGTNGTPFDLSTLRSGEIVYINTTERVELTGNATNVCIETNMNDTDIELIDVSISSNNIVINVVHTGCKLTVTGANTMISSTIDAAIKVTTGYDITIDGTGSLDIDISSSGYGIGCNILRGDCGTINIKGGTINIVPADGVAIGGMNAVINIHGGNVYATASYDYAAIGGAGAGLMINIYGGRAETFAVHGSESGIGSNLSTVGGTINIYGGLVIARGGYEDGWGEYAAAIGGGAFSTFDAVTIAGGQVYAMAGSPLGDDIGASNTGICAGVNLVGNAAVFLFNDKIYTAQSRPYTHVNSEVVVGNSAYGFSDFPNEFEGRVAYGYLYPAVVTFEYLDGVTPDRNENYWCGNKVIEPADPTRLGYVFNGWHVDPSGIEPYLFDATPVIGNTIIYADWIEQGTHSGAIEGTLVDSAGNPIEGYYTTLQSRPVTTTTTSTGSFAFGAVYYVDHTLIISDNDGNELDRYRIVMVEGTTPGASVAGNTITVEYVGNTTRVRIPLRYNGTSVDVSGTVEVNGGEVSNVVVNPQTGDDGFNMYILAGMLALVLIGVYMTFRKRASAK